MFINISILSRRSAYNIVLPVLDKMYHIVAGSLDCVRKWDFRGRTWINRRKMSDRDKRNRDTRNEFQRSIFATKFLAPLSDNRKFVRTNTRFEFFTLTLSNACANKKIKENNWIDWNFSNRLTSRWILKMDNSRTILE